MNGATHLICRLLVDVREAQDMVAGIMSILELSDEHPPFDEVLADVEYGGSNNHHVNLRADQPRSKRWTGTHVVPWHPRRVES